MSDTPDNAADAVLALELDELVRRRVLDIIDKDFDKLFEHYVRQNPDRFIRILEDMHARARYSYRYDVTAGTRFF